MKQVKPRIYIESGISLDRDVLRRCREQNLDRLRGIEVVLIAKLFRWIEMVLTFYQANREFRNMAQWIGLSIQRYEENPGKLR